mmetsp:Transcript_27774/g.58351  ORF Transcript_27774/g.58351 Transcript_27774/m.58351 type:complete len:329 (+) Transcript_27774:320-1306(+)
MSRIASRIRIVARIRAVLAVSFPAMETRIVTQLTLTLTLIGLRKGTGNGPQGVILLTAVGVVTACVFVVAGIVFGLWMHMRIWMWFWSWMFAVVMLRTRLRLRMLRRMMHGKSRGRRRKAMVVMVMTVMGIAMIATTSISLPLVGRGVIRVVMGMMIRVRMRRVVISIGITRMPVSAVRKIMRWIRRRRLRAVRRAWMVTVWVAVARMRWIGRRRAVVVIGMVVPAEVIGTAAWSAVGRRRVMRRRVVGRLVGMRGSTGGVFHTAGVRVIRRRRACRSAGVMGGMMRMIGRFRSAGLMARWGLIAGSGGVPGPICSTIDDAPGRRPMR